jgi:peptidoglycan/LPS O-acetylase OafA/YrhL
MKRLDQLTFTRFLALLLVLCYHGAGGIYRQAIDVFPVSSVLRAAPTAVSFLYVLSGFVMSLVYHRPLAKFNIRAYWTARFVRIYPLYFIAFLLVCLYYLEYMPRISAVKILANILALQAWIPSYAQSFNYPSWSLTVEFFFYALFPFITMWSYRQSMRKLIWVSLGLWGASQLVHYFLWAHYFPAWENILVYSPVFHLNSFVLGVVGGAWYAREAPKQSLAPRVTLPLLGLGLGLLLAFMILGDLYPRFPHDLQPMQGLFSPICLLVILALGADRSRLSVTLNHRWPVLLGETAYALYILQAPLIWLYERALQASTLSDPTGVQEATVLPLMLLVGLVAHLYVDLPLRRWLANLMRRVSPAVVLLDLAAVALAVYLAFVVRFGGGRDLREFSQAGYLMFWLAFVVRTCCATIFRSNDPRLLRGRLQIAIMRAGLSVGVGSLALALLMWLAFALSWIPGFPRGVIFLEGALMLCLSVLNRQLFRRAERQQTAGRPASAP